MEIMQCKEDKKKDFNYSHEMQKMIEGERQKCYRNKTKEEVRYN